MFNFKDMTMKQINRPRTHACVLFDDTFKVVIFSPRNRDFLIQLIELMLPGKKIRDIAFLSSENHGLVVSDKNINFDMFCTEKDTGEQFLVEMQFSGEDSYQDRMLSYSTYPIRVQLTEKLEAIERGEKIDKMDYSLRPLYVISILNFKIDHTGDEALEDGFISRYSIRNDANGELMTDALHFVYFELGRLKARFGEENKCVTVLEQVAYSLKYGHMLKERPENFRDEILKLLYRAINLANLTQKELENYDKIMTTKLDIIAQINYAERKAREEGAAEGETRGKAEVARNMLAKGIAADVVSECTGLSVEEAQALAEK